MEGGGAEPESLACRLAESIRTNRRTCLSYVIPQSVTQVTVIEHNSRFPDSLIVALSNYFAPRPTLKVTRGYLVHLHDSGRQRSHWP